MAGQLADHIAAWGEMRPQSWEEFVEDALTQRELVEEGLEGPWSDDVGLLSYLEKMASRDGESLEACYREVVADTTEMVWKHWPEVEAVAGALEQRAGHLDEETFLEVMEAVA